ncbi:MAG: ATP-dependent protease LonB [Candidatus Diapherotrites archaeon]|nr:ATP-dependent protease LonB [Candidatus Diapherotrites archaeon]
MPPAKTTAKKSVKKKIAKDFFDFKTTAEIKIPDKLADQIIGQDKAVELIKKAAEQRRNVLLIGLPGTGKSMLAQAMAELLPVQKLKDILIYPNPIDPNNPKVVVVDAGEGIKILEKARLDAKQEEDSAKLLAILIPLGWFIVNYILYAFFGMHVNIYAATIVVGGFLLVAFSLGAQMRIKSGSEEPKLLVDNSDKKSAPFLEATGARAGALLGDVRHDPLQSGGLGTPPHLRVEPGMIHRANGGVLFIDEIATLSPKSQQELLTAMQEKKYSITGQSEMSSGAMTRTDPVPCDFVLVAAGNYEDLEKVHPALRSRIRGYGYEIYMNLDMPDNEQNRKKLVQFVAQEVVKDGKIPHFSKEAVEQIVFEAKRRSGRKNKFTLKLRDLGGLVRAAGDIAKSKGKNIVDVEDVLEAKASAKTLEQQMVVKYMEEKKDYDVYLTKGSRVGRVNGLAVLAEGDAGIVMPIEAEVAPAASKEEGKIIATGKLGEIAKEAVQNVSAIIKKLSGKDISKYDIHVQFLQSYSGVEGDSASVSVATAVISAMENIPIKQSIAMTGSLSVRGEVLPVGGVSAKVEAAIDSGLKEVIIPKSNLGDVIINKEKISKIKLIAASNLSDVIENAFVDCEAKKSLLNNLKSLYQL